MKKQYIKFIEGDKESLKQACKIAEDNGYKELEDRYSLDFEGFGIFCLDEDGTYYTDVWNEETALQKGYTLLTDLTINNKGVKKYKLLKDLAGINAGNTFDENNTYAPILDFTNKEWFEEIKEEETPKFKIGDKVVVLEGKYGIILNIHIKDDFEYLVGTYWVYANQLRKPTEEEMQKYFN